MRRGGGASPGALPHGVGSRPSSHSTGPGGSGKSLRAPPSRTHSGSGAGPPGGSWGNGTGLAGGASLTRETIDLSGFASTVRARIDKEKEELFVVKWRAVMALRPIVKQVGFRRLYGILFRAEPKYFITKVRFQAVLHKVLESLESVAAVGDGVHGAGSRSVTTAGSDRSGGPSSPESAVKRLFMRLFYCAARLSTSGAAASGRGSESGMDERADWREILCCMWRVLHPEASMAQFLEQGFALYTGDPGAPKHLGAGAAIHREDMKSLFTMCAASAQQQAAMQEEVLAAWNEITEDAPVSVLMASKRVAHAGDRGTVGVPIGPFRALLRHAMLHDQVQLPWGAREADAPTVEAQWRHEVRRREKEEEEAAVRAAASRRRAAERRAMGGAGVSEGEEGQGTSDAVADALATLRAAGQGVLAETLEIPPASEEAVYLAPLELRYAPVLRAFLARERRRRSARARLHRVIAERHTAAAHAVFQRWFGQVEHRLRARRAVANLARKWRDSGLRRAAEALFRHAIRCCAAERIQAVARGRRGRRLHGQAVRRHRAARRLQRWWRGYRFGMEGLAIRSKRKRAAIDIQRMWRGFSGRVRARKRKLAMYRAEFERLRAARRTYMERNLHVAAAVIQSAVRSALLPKVRKRELERKLAEEVPPEVVERLQREQEVAAHKALLHYRYQVRTFYDSLAQREEEEREQSSANPQHLEKLAIYRRRRRAQLVANRQEKERKEKEARERASAESFKREWEARMEEAVTLENERLRGLFAAVPEDKAGRAERAKLLKRLKKDVKAMRARAKKEGRGGVAVAQLTLQAQSAIVKEGVDAKREEIAAAREEAARAKEERRERAAREQERRTAKSSKRNRAVSATQIQRIFRGRRGRKRARNEAVAQYSRPYDPHTGTFYYYNCVTGESQHAQPRVLKDLLDLESTWFLVRDPSEPHRYSHYFNPRGFRVAWELPEEVDEDEVVVRPSLPVPVPWPPRLTLSLLEQEVMAPVPPQPDAAPAAKVA